MCRFSLLQGYYKLIYTMDDNRAVAESLSRVASQSRAAGQKCTFGYSQFQHYTTKSTRKYYSISTKQLPQMYLIGPVDEAEQSGWKYHKHIKVISTLLYVIEVRKFI